jgi:Ca2+-binding RTX toxin-like protein
MRVAGKLLVCLFVLLGSLVSAAAAATRYAEPGGNGPAGICPQSDPCEVHDAVSDASVNPGDVVLLLPGDYVLGAQQLNVGAAITVAPAQAGTRPRILANGDTAIQITDAAVISGLYIEGRNSPNAAVFDLTFSDPTRNPVLDRLVVVSPDPDGSDTPVRISAGATVQNTLVESAVFNGFLIFAEGGGTPPVGIRNSTLIATDQSTPAIFATADAGFGAPYTVEVVNTIARVADPNGALVVQDGDPANGPDTAINVSYSNFNGVDETPPDASVNEGAGNQSSSPLFSNPGILDYSQLSGSATIDAGLNDGLSGPFDLSGAARVQGASVDIGADEFDVAASKCAGKPATKVGTASRDIIAGTPGRDVILGLGGKDTLKGFAGNDVLCGGPGDDSLLGKGGRDRLLGQKGGDFLRGANGNDLLKGGSGRDIMTGRKGRDRLFGGRGQDTLIGGPGRDRLRGGPGRDFTSQ